MQNNLFARTGGLNPRRSMFDLSYRKTFTCDMGQLIPIMCDEVVPGDMWEVGNEIVVRYQPLVAPILHEVNVYTHYYFVPYRILWDQWEDFITGGVDGQSAAVLPRWSPTLNAEGTLWDYLGLPTGIVPTDALPVDFIRRAYNKIYNEFYRDENLIAQVAETNEAILNRAWEKDYFTSSLPWQQRGIAPALPISGLTSAVWPDTRFVDQNTSTGFAAMSSKNTESYVYGSVNGSIARTNMRDFLIQILLICLVLLLLMYLILGLLFKFKNGWSGMLALVCVTRNFLRHIMACLLVMIAYIVLSILVVVNLL